MATAAVDRAQAAGEDPTAAAASGSSLVMASQPGFLTLAPLRAQQLVAQDSLEQWYTLENQPFARGKFAAVKKCRQKNTGQEFAAKIIRKRRRGPGLTAECLHEAATLDLCRSCPHIVRLEQVFDSPAETILVLQLAEGGELQSVLDREEVPQERDVIRFLRQVLGGLAFLHRFDIAHLDLKPQNLVLTGPFPDCDIKLCDFGISRHIACGADVREILGTPDYVAPEILNYEPISLATDMWSVGVLAYVLLTGCTPFGGDTKQETFCNITRCQLEFPEDLFHNVSGLAVEFISGLLVHDASARMTALECLQHPWLRCDDSSTALGLCSIESSSCNFSSSSTIVADDDDREEDQVDRHESDGAAGVVAGHVLAANSADRCTQEMTSSEQSGAAGAGVMMMAAGASNKVVKEAQLRPAPTCFSGSKRAASLPYRWKTTAVTVGAAAAVSRREASCDRASDLGYGSDGISEVSSTDSSSDRSSIISLDESPLEWNQNVMRRYSDPSSAAERLWRQTWERFLPTTQGSCAALPYHVSRQRSASQVTQDVQHESDQHDEDEKPWQKVCIGILARAMQRFNSPGSQTADDTCKTDPQPVATPVVKPIASVSEVRSRLLQQRPATCREAPVVASRSPLFVHADKSLVKARLGRFQTTHHSPAS